MKWYNPLTWVKANPAQGEISRDEGYSVATDQAITYTQAFDKLEAVNRGVNMIVSACSSLDYDVKKKSNPSVVNAVRQTALHTLLNFRPNEHQSVQDFRTNIFTDFILEGNIFIYYDGAYMYHLPARNVEIVPDPKAYVKEYIYNSTVKMRPDEIIHIKDLSSTSIYRGTSRLASADRNIKIQYAMQKFQEDFFNNGAITGLILCTDNVLGQQAKEKTIQGWMSKYSPNKGARRPLILDGGLKPQKLTEESFKDMDFDTSIQTHDNKILKSLGVPSILLDGGNNANISPNLRLFYLETVLPIVTRYVSALERYFGYDLSPITSNVSALQPELKDLSQYYTTLVNGGILTPNESRVELRYEKVTDPSADTLRVPANIAGSAANPSEGGRPPANQNSGKELHG